MEVSSWIHMREKKPPVQLNENESDYCRRGQLMALTDEDASLVEEALAHEPIDPTTHETWVRVRLPAEDLRAVEDLARARHLNPTTLLRIAIHSWVVHEIPEPKRVNHSRTQSKHRKAA
jgi:hypothetical protein